MEFEKRRLAHAEMGYFITHLPLLGQERIIAATEAEGPALVFTPPAYESHTIATGPGGCMGFAPLPGRGDAFLMITRFYPIFQSEAAGIDLFTAVDGLDTPWTGRRILDLPFVHRICTLSTATGAYLVAATVCGGKDFQDDWSRPGLTYAAKIPNDPAGPWDLRPITAPIHRNHGMHRGRHEGRDCVFITGDEGLFALEPPAAGTSDWTVTHLIAAPISEVYAADLDGDGRDEFAVIEPFHGEALSVYKSIDGLWTRVFTAPLAFGHGLWAGQLGAERVAVAGNRAGDCDLACWRVTGTQPFAMERLVVDAGAGTTNMDVLDTPRGPALVTSNPGHTEYALYVPR